MARLVTADEARSASALMAGPIASGQLRRGWPTPVAQKRRQETTRAGGAWQPSGVGALPRGNEEYVQFLGYMLTIIGAALVLAAIAYVLG